MTTMQVLSALERAGFAFGESKIKTVLAAEVTAGRLTSRRGGPHAGDELPGWPEGGPGA
jgi:hypothetical protein